MQTGRVRFDVDRVEQQLRSRELDAVLLRTGQNVAYLSGMEFPGTLGRLQDFAAGRRAAVLVWPRDGEPTLFTSEIATPLARRDSWLDDVRPFAEYADDQFRLAAERIADGTPDAQRVGIESDWLTVSQVESVREGLPGVDLVDCGDLLDDLRAVKTPAERSILREAAAIQDAAHREVFEGARPGDTERDLHARLLAAMTRRGADRAHGMLQSGRTAVTYGGERSVSVERGDAIRTDYVCYLDGYAANLSRMAVVGPPDAAQRSAYETVRSVHRETIETAIRPGAAAADVYRFVRERFAERGVDSIPGLVGHGIGIWWHQEEPILAAGESRRLRPGMVVCLEPVLDDFWHLQDEVLVTEDGPELISDGFDTRELYVIE